MAIDVGFRVGIDGEIEFKKTLATLTQKSKELAAEMKSVTSAFDKNDKSQEAVTAQSKVLEKQIETQKEKLSLLAEKYDSTSKRLEELKEAAVNASKQFGEDSKQAIKATQAYDRQAESVSKAKTDVNNATAALNKMTSQLSNLENGVDDAGNAMQDAGNQSITFGELIKANVISDFIISGIKRLADVAKDMAKTFVENAATVRAESSQFKQTFGELEGDATSALQAISNDSGILVTRLKGASAQIYAFAKSSGGTATESLDLMNRALKVSADSAAYYDRSLEETTESLRSFLKGNFENDAALGVSCTETTRNAKAMELFGSKYNELTEIQKQQTLLTMVEDANKLSGAMGQAAREADGWENVIGNLSEAWKQATAVIGTPIMDSITPIIKNVTNSLMGFADGTLSVNGFIQEMIGMISNLVLKFTENMPQFVSAGSEIIGSMVSGVITALPQLLESGQAMLASLTGYLSENLPQMISSGLNALLGFSDGLKTNVGNLVDSAITMIKTLADGLIASLPDLIAKVPLIVSNIANIINENAPKLLFCAAEIIGKLAIGLIQNIPTILANLPQIIKAIVDVFTAFNWIALGSNIITMLKNGISGMVGTVKNAAGDVLKSIEGVLKNLPSTLKNIGSSAASFLSSGITGMLGTIGNAGAAILRAVVNAVTAMPRMLFDIAKNTISSLWQAFTTGDWSGIGRNIIDGIVRGIRTAVGGLVSSAIDAAMSAFNAAKRALGIHSPSRLFRDQIGKMIPQGMAVGIESDAYMVSDAAKESALAAVYSAQDGMNDVIDSELRLNAALTAAHGKSRSVTQNKTAGNSVNMGGISITINPTPGMDVNALADAVAYKIQAMAQGKAAVW